LQTIEAFTRLWQAGQDINLVVVGREGWRGVPDEARRSIPQTMACLRSHAELGKRLLWLEDASDEYLEQAYAASTCLIAASEGEGFGLPLIEAAQKRMPILARDIPIFREVAGGHAHFFDGLAPEDMADAVVAWLRLSESGQAPTSAEMPWLTWRQSTELLLTRIELN
jgi:glycosyltransferase involved in cell wall biosynthesis